MKISVVATLYHSAAYIAEFHRRMTEAVTKITDDYEIILVNDGSPDNSLAVALTLVEKDRHVKVVDLSRNFGHHKAMMTGLSYATGERVFLIDTDLEEEPEWLPTFSDHMNESRCDVVYGVQKRRRGNWFERLAGAIFYKLFRILSGENFPESNVTSRLMTKRYVDALLRFGEREVYLAAIWHITGFDQRPLTVTKHSFSPTTYTLRKKIAMVVNSITSFSNAPLVLIFYLGVVILLFAVLFTAYTVVLWMFLSKPLTGWTSVICSIWLLGGLMLCFMGTIGIYLSKIFSEVKQRPYSIVRNVYGE